MLVLYLKTTRFLYNRRLANYIYVYHIIHTSIWYNIFLVRAAVYPQFLICVCVCVPVLFDLLGHFGIESAKISIIYEASGIAGVYVNVYRVRCPYLACVYCSVCAYCMRIYHVDHILINDYIQKYCAVYKVLIEPFIKYPILIDIFYVAFFSLGFICVYTLSIMTQK